MSDNSWDTDAALLCRIRKIILSPHSDDACFSLGYLALKSPSACVVTVFSQSGYLPGMHGKDQTSKVKQVTKVRQKEDREFASRARINLKELGLLDAPLRGITAPLDRQPDARDLDYVHEPLNRCMQSLRVQDGDPCLLLVPLGVGNHIDHLTLRDWTLRHFADLRKHYQIGFYEDLHYASVKQARDAAIRDFKQRLTPELTCRRIELPLGRDDSLKLELVRSYTSQFARGVPRISQFTPATRADAEPHEAVWLLTDGVSGHFE